MVSHYHFIAATHNPDNNDVVVNPELGTTGTSASWFPQPTMANTFGNAYWDPIPFSPTKNGGVLQNGVYVPSEFTGLYNFQSTLIPPAPKKQCGPARIRAPIYKTDFRGYSNGKQS